MKKIIVVAQFSAYVPDDMKVSQVQDLCETEIREEFSSFRISVTDYSNESESEPLFELDDVMCGTNSMVSIGGE